MIATTATVTQVGLWRDWRSWPANVSALWRRSLRFRTLTITLLLTASAVFVTCGTMALVIANDLFFLDSRGEGGGGYGGEQEGRGGLGQPTGRGGGLPLRLCVERCLERLPQIGGRGLSRACSRCLQPGRDGCALPELLQRV